MVDKKSSRARALVAVAAVLLGLAPRVEGQPTNSPAPEKIVLPKSVPDPLEPMNRALWAFNKGVMSGVIQPTSKFYRAVVVKPVRNGISNMGKNIVYPKRLMNNLLQQKWVGARDETYRFLCNSTLGVAGFFDVATKKWKIPASDADFGQTLGQWGWEPHFFLMLPFVGPSNDRDTVGYAVDTAANPLIYITPYDFEANNPATYLGPYSYFSYGVMYNDLSDSVDEYVRFSRAEMDPYSELQYAWTFARANRVADFEVKGTQDQASLETIESVFFTFQDPEFPRHARTQSVLIPSTKRKLQFTYWMQKGKADVVYIVPGLGSHRLANTSLALAELAYKNGFSVVCVSSPFNSEFMEHASTAPMPAYLPVDGRDLHAALTEVDRQLNRTYPNRFLDRALMGYSMGALESLYLAGTESTNQEPLLKFDRYVAINTPVRMIHGASKLDEYYNAPLQWPTAERTDNLENTFLKVAALSKGSLTPHSSLPFSAVESQFLVGLTFRLMLRDIIFTSQRRNNQGVLQHPIKNFRRDPIYQEILAYSYHDYFEKFAIPYYQSRGIGSAASQAIESAGDLHTYENGLRANPKIRVITNQNDFLLADEDLAWLQKTFSPEQLTIFKQGGHLGNLGNPAVQKAILDGLIGSKASPPKSDGAPVVPVKPVKPVSL